MKKYVAYNKHYKNGKPFGRKYKVEKGTNKTELKKRVEQENRRWSNIKSNKKNGISAKLVEIKSNKTVKKKGFIRFDWF